MVNLSDSYKACSDRLFHYISMKLNEELKSLTPNQEHRVQVDLSNSEILSIVNDLDCFYGAVNRMKSEGWKVEESWFDADGAHVIIRAMLQMFS